MSYILSALRKAEHDRQAPGSDSFINVGRGVVKHDKEGRKNILIIVLAAMLVACIVYLMISRLAVEHPPALSNSPASTPSVRQTPEEGVVASKSRILAVSTTSSMPQRRAVDNPPSQNELSGSKTERAGEPELQIESHQPAAEPAEIENTDDSSFPALNITGYIYFENAPERSKLFIDGIVYRANSRVRQGLVIQSFQKNSVIFSYHGRDHSVAVN